ncbi:MFS transporter [Galactobacter valiniphilus]|uniref:MFS transporter n=1 Tax=Galactobacter valiniphilus TaxID=2676122 RepID=A0A399JAV0_9MICC|nr:MFS transporter [Galactobacter valiniphilus]RII41667.1 MFS transporter [Galactobacter valiniphilus]
MSASPKVPGVVWLLAAVIFALGTSEFMIAGLLENIVADLGVSLSAAGLLVTGFALGMIAGAPLMTVLTLRLPVRVTLVGAAAVFAAAHVMGALAPGYGVLMASRVIAAVACGAFWAVASVHTSRVASPAVLGRSLATLVGGMTIANVVGVPGGAWLGNAFGWRSAFWTLAAVTVVAGLLVAFTVRPAPRGDLPPLRELIGRELEAFKHRRIWLSLSVTALFQAAVFAFFSYFSPLLTQVAGLPLDAVPAVLAAFGVGTFIGVSIGGRLADDNLFGNMIGSLAALVASFVILALTAGWAPGAIAAMVLVGISGFSIAGALNARVFQVAGAAPTLASAVNTSAFNVGNALGPALGAWVLAAGAPVVTTVWLGAGLAAVACVLAVAVKATDARWAALEVRPAGA